MSASSSTFRPVTVPSRRAASVSFWIWSRPWCAASMDSLRDSVYLTGLPSRRATSRAITSSGVTCSLPPKPPPTSGAMTRNLCSGISSVIASMSRRMCGIWVADHTVSCGPVGSTTTERGSMNAGISRCWRKVRCTTTSASRMACFDVTAGAGLRGVERPDRADVGAEIGMHQVGAVGGRGREIEHDRQFVVVDVDRLERVVRFIGAAGHHDGDGFAGEVHRVHRERGCGRRLHVFGDLPRARQAALLGGEVGAGEDRDDTGHGARGVGVDTGDAGMRERDCAESPDVACPATRGCRSTGYGR